MRTRAWRWILFTVLLASGVGAALSGWTTSRRIAELDRSQRDLSADIDRLLATLDAVATAQNTRGSASVDQAPDRVSSLIEQIRSESEALRPHVRSSDGGRALNSVVASVSTLREFDVRVQEHLRLGQDLMAGDLLSSDGRLADEAIGTGLRNVRAAESEAFATARADVLDFMWTVGGAVATFWVLGLVLLTSQSTVVVKEEASPVISAHTLLAPALADFRLDAAPAPATHLDLQAAADVCTAIGRLTSAADLPRLLQQAATVMDASGVVVWMAAGDELFAAAAFGYSPQVMRKLGPINRAAVNATAAAWRTSIVQTVSGGGADRSALAVPMLGPDRCIGVLAVEVNIGREDDAATKAVTTLVAAQLAAALAGWPAASATAPMQAPPLDAAAEA